MCQKYNFAVKVLYQWMGSVRRGIEGTVMWRITPFLLTRTANQYLTNFFHTLGSYVLGLLDYSGYRLVEHAIETFC